MTSLSSLRSTSFQAPPSASSIRFQFDALLSEDSEDENTTTGQEEQDPGTSQDLPRAERARTDSSNDKIEIAVSLIWSENQVGAAYYNISTSELFVMEDMNDDITNYSVTKALYRECKPRYVISSNGCPDGFLTALKKLTMTEQFEEEANTSTSSEGNYRAALKLMTKKDCNYERCYHRVRCLQLQSEPETASNEERLIFLNSILDFKARAMIYALGVLLIFLDTHWSQIALSSSGKATFVSIKFMSLKDLVIVDSDTYRALNITQTRYHPSFFKFGNSTTRTQRVSLFTFLNRCQSRPGTQFLWKTLQHPTKDIAILNQRYDAIDFFLETSNHSIVDNFLSCLKHVHRLTNVILSRCSGPQARPSDWQKLYKTLSHVIYIAEICAGHQEKIKLFGAIARSITSDVQYVKYFIDYIVDFEASRHDNEFVVKPNVDPLHDELIHLRDSLPHLLSAMGEKDMREHLPASVTGCNMFYLPNIGYVLAIKEWNPTPPDEMLFPGLEFKFTINGVRYYKSPSARELDNTIGDIILKINKRRSKLLLKLVKYISKHAQTILAAIELCAELDTLLAFAAVARDNDYVRPKMVESQIIDVKEGRHPLQEFSMTYVSNDILSGGDASCLKILTGPNTCGKSMYLKQVGLVVFMAHIGCFVPAKSATIGTVSHILTQIFSVDSVALDASTFLQSLRQINSAVSTSTANSLVIIDEFGKGTSETSGFSLLAAVLQNFIDRGEACPHVFAATHIHRVIGILPESPLIQAQTFEYVVNEDQTLAFLYRLTNGSATLSYAHSVAQTAGLDRPTLKRSLEVYERLKEGALPTPMPETHRQNTARHIVERVVVSENLNLDELKSWVRQAILPVKKNR